MSNWKTPWDVADLCYTVASRRLVGSLAVTCRVLVRGINVEYVTQKTMSLVYVDQHAEPRRLCFVVPCFLEELSRTFVESR